MPPTEKDGGAYYFWLALVFVCVHATLFMSLVTFEPWMLGS